MSVKKISDTNIAIMKNASVYGLSDTPTASGNKASDIKKHMYGFIIDNKVSVVEEINRIVEETNEEIIEAKKPTVVKNVATNILDSGEQASVIVTQVDKDISFEFNIPKTTDVKEVEKVIDGKMSSISILDLYNILNT